MNSKIFAGGIPRFVTVYNGGFQTLRSRLSRTFSTQNGGPAVGSETVVVFDSRGEPEKESALYAKLYDDKFGKKYRHFPLPGNVCTSHHFLEVKEKEKIATPKTVSCVDQSDVLKVLPTHERQVLAMYSSGYGETIQTNQPMMAPALPPYLECAAHACPELAKQQFSDLFPQRTFKEGPLTVMTLTQKTANDMSEWTSDVDQERDDLVGQFISTASEICQALKRHGFWADLIDPSSGRPYLGPFTNDTLFESDERYRFFGFTIEDLGCCKVIKHHAWGTHAFVGSIFTNAPLESDILQDILKRSRDIEGAVKAAERSKSVTHERKAKKHGKTLSLQPNEKS